MQTIPIPTKEAIVEQYITGCHTKEECCDFFKVSAMTFSRWLKKYGIVKTKQDIQNTNLQKYGVVHSAQLKSTQEKRKQTCEKKYGADNCMKTPQVRDKLKQTCLEKYGSSCVLTNDTIKEKIKNTCIERYGVDNPFKSPKVQDRIKQTINNKYGCKHVLQCPEIVERMKNTCGINRAYRVQEESVQEVSQNSLEQYTLTSYQQKDIQHLDIWTSVDKMELLLQSYEEKPTIQDLMLFFNVSDVGIGHKIHEYHLEDLVNFRPSRSRYENEIIDFLASININNLVLNDRAMLDGQEIDIYLPDYQLGIEFNGDYWHSDIYHADHQGRSTYHQQKSLLAESKGIFLFHIFEYEWNNPIVQENIKNRLMTLLSKNTVKIAARKCEIKEINKKTKKDFLNQYHIQGNDHSTVCLGLYYNNELISCMTFVHPKSNKYTWELSRFCSKHGYNIMGGASKLFTYFVNTLDVGSTISSFNDITKTRGDLYKTLGFECKSINSPNYVWINFNTNDIRTRYQEQKGGERQRMNDAGYHRVCDCGTKTWVYTKQ